MGLSWPKEIKVYIFLILSFKNVSKESAEINAASDYTPDTTYEISSMTVTVPINIELTTTVGTKQLTDKHITSPSKYGSYY